MNVHDSDQLATMMVDDGFEQTEDVRQAQVILVNTCSIREKVAQKIISQIGRYRQLKENNPDLVIGVGGCLAQHQEAIRNKYRQSSGCCPGAAGTYQADVAIRHQNTDHTRPVRLYPPFL